MIRSSFIRTLLIVICILAFVSPVICLNCYYTYFDPTHQSIDFILKRLDGYPYISVGMWVNYRIEDDMGNYVIYRNNVLGSIKKGSYLRRYIGQEFDLYYKTFYKDTELLKRKWYYPISPSDGSYLICESPNGELSLWEYVSSYSK